jgi:hypothetical protein
VTESQSGANADEDEMKKDWKFGRNEGPMNWGWKLTCAILYMLPWTDVTEKTVYLIERFPAFHWAEYFTGEPPPPLLLAPASPPAGPRTGAPAALASGSRCCRRSPAAQPRTGRTGPAT